MKPKFWKRCVKWLLVVIVGGTVLAISQNWGVYLFGPPIVKSIASIEFEDAKPFVDRVVLGDKQWNGYHFQVRIQNESDRSTIRVKHWKLTDLRQLEGDTFKAWGDAVPSFLEWPRGTPKEIPPRDQVFVPFARIYPPEVQKMTDRLLSGDINTPQLRFTIFPWDRRMTSHIPPGIHRFRLTVFFEDIPPREVELELEWPGKHRESVESMAQETSIRRVDKRSREWLIRMP